MLTLLAPPFSLFFFFCLLGYIAILAPLSHPHLPVLTVQVLCTHVCLLQAKMGSTPPRAAAVNTANLGYTGALDACLLLLGPAVLYAYKHGVEGDRELPPGGGGCPLDDNGMPMKRVSVREGILNMFGTTTVRIGNTAGKGGLGVVVAQGAAASMSAVGPSHLHTDRPDMLHLA